MDGLVEACQKAWGWSEPKKCNEPHLGLATTQDLLLELKARGETEVTYTTAGKVLIERCEELIEVLPQQMRDYRTVGSD